VGRRYRRKKGRWVDLQSTSAPSPGADCSLVIPFTPYPVRLLFPFFFQCFALSFSIHLYPLQSIGGSVCGICSCRRQNARVVRARGDRELFMYRSGPRPVRKVYYPVLDALPDMTQELLTKVRCEDSRKHRFGWRTCSDGQTDPA
jgi:hypothetical protein